MSRLESCFVILIFVIFNLAYLIVGQENVTYSIRWPFDHQLFDPSKSDENHQIEKPDLKFNPNLNSLINLYTDLKENSIQIDEDQKYDRENQLLEETRSSDSTKADSGLVVNKSEIEFRPTIDPIVPIIKRMLRRKDIRKEYPNYEFKRRKGTLSSNYNDETTRRSSNKVYSDEDDHSSYADGDEEEEDAYYEDDNYGKKSLGAHQSGWSPSSSLSALPIHDHYYTGSTGVPSYWNHWNHGHYYPYYAQPYHGGHHLHKYGKHFYREEYAIILVVISLAAFLGLIFSLFMPYAFIQSSALTGLPSNTVPYTNAVTTLNGNQFGNAAVTSDVNRIPINVFSTGKRRRKRTTGNYANRYSKTKSAQKNGDFRILMNKFSLEHARPFDELLSKMNLYESLINHQILDFAVQTTFNLLNNL